MYLDYSCVDIQYKHFFILFGRTLIQCFSFSIVGWVVCLFSTLDVLECVKHFQSSVELGSYASEPT